MPHPGWLRLVELLMEQMERTFLSLKPTSFFSTTI